ncbi:hypothetical protein M1M34_gp067 [Haloarcula tailed virus 2]|uniref:Uncharacterized protein n=1 Tax=Haloarcula tailed virus 2 TaxID=2877989 RepID=A0AAE8XZD7_9CAUD|nr:hypothetical protein M1M34_gp067 [Haloarcula tailed virus 2]UBF23266.1 hypothetical protein HATV-2_gp115 [Haloarcula tailed virus 2]
MSNSEIHIHLYKCCGNKYIYPVAPRAGANCITARRVRKSTDTAKRRPLLSITKPLIQIPYNSSLRKAKP